MGKGNRKLMHRARHAPRRADGSVPAGVNTEGSGNISVCAEPSQQSGKDFDVVHVSDSRLNQPILSSTNRTVTQEEATSIIEGMSSPYDIERMIVALATERYRTSGDPLTHTEFGERVFPEQKESGGATWRKVRAENRRISVEEAAKIAFALGDTLDHLVFDAIQALRIGRKPEDILALFKNEPVKGGGKRAKALRQ